jgi:hypothetical protein
VSLWNLNETKIIYNIVENDNPKNTITHLEFHPTNPNLFLFSSSGGYFEQCDLRVSSQIQEHAIKFEIEKKGKEHFF